MAKFSERNGMREPKGLQLRGMDTDLRNGLWNVVSPAFFVYKRDYGRTELPGYWPWERELGVRLWRDFFKYPVDTMPAAWNTIAAQIREWFFKASWYEVYDLVEFLAIHAPSTGFTSENVKRIQEDCNRMLEREASAFRFLQGQIQPITDAAEMETVDAALAPGASQKPVREHLRRALELLSARPEPDYKNSIRESLRAVAALCEATMGRKLPLEEVLQHLAGQSGPHNALRSSFNEMFGYSADGHTAGLLLLDQADLSFDEAKFMLVACAAFINYLRVKAPLLKGPSPEPSASTAPVPALAPPRPSRRSR